MSFKLDRRGRFQCPVVTSRLLSTLSSDRVGFAPFSAIAAYDFVFKQCEVCTTPTAFCFRYDRNGSTNETACAVVRADPAKVCNEYTAEDHETKFNVCYRELWIFLGSGRSQNWIELPEIALSGRWLYRGQLPSSQPKAEKASVQCEKLRGSFYTQKRFNRYRR